MECKFQYPSCTKQLRNMPSCFVQFGTKTLPMKMRKGYADVRKRQRDSVFKLFGIEFQMTLTIRMGQGQT